MREGGAVRELVRRYLRATACKSLGRLLADAAARRHGIEHHIGGLHGGLRQHERGLDRLKVEGRGAARDEHQVGRARGERDHLVGIRRGVEHKKVRPVLPRGVHQRRQAGRLPADDFRRFCRAGGRPSLRLSPADQGR